VRRARPDARADAVAPAEDLTGARVLDAGCGAGQMTQELARAGAEVVAVDISPSLVEIARARLPEASATQVTFSSGDMLSPDLGRFDHVIAMDSLIYYTGADIAARWPLAARTRGGRLHRGAAHAAADGDVAGGQAVPALRPVAHDGAACAHGAPRRCAASDAPGTLTPSSGHQRFLHQPGDGVSP
jgi:SAM-dependent methyltransferase